MRRGDQRDTFVMLMQKNEQERVSKAERLSALLFEVEQSEKKIVAIHNWALIIKIVEPLLCSPSPDFRPVRQQRRDVF